MQTCREQNPLPTNLRYQRTPLPDSANSLGSWQQAIALLPPDLGLERAASYLLYGPEDVEATEPTVSEYDALREWCSHGEPCLAAIDLGLQRVRLQLPETNGFGLEWEGLVALISELRKISHLRNIKAKLLERAGEYTEATFELVQLLRMGQRICDGDGLIVCYLAGSGIRGRALSQLTELVQSKRLDSATTRLLHDELLQSASQPEGLSQATRAELFQFGIPAIEAVPESDDIPSHVDYLHRVFYDTEELSDLDDSAGKISDQIREQRQSRRREQLQQLLAGHPKLFDRDETLQALIQSTSHYIGWLEFVMRKPQSRWRHRLRDFASKRHWANVEQLAAWPEVLSPKFPFTLFGEDEAAESARKALTGSTSEDYPVGWRPLSDAQVAHYNEQLKRVPNPVGKLLVAQQIGFDASSLGFSYLQSIQATIQQCARQL